MGLVSLGACVAGFVLDFIFGDPVWLYHPVRLIGKWISFLEKLLRRKTGEKRQIAAGGILWILTVAVVYSVTAGILWIVRKWSPAAGFILETFWCYQIFAARCLVSESGKVYERLKEKDLPGSRKAVSMIVGRDTENLSFEGVTKAAVETVAENTSDGVTAPLLYLLLGGAPLGFLYKAVNTMDSMLGYKNETYLYFGRIPAKMDDLFNYIPARLTAWFMVLASFLTGLNGKNVCRVTPHSSVISLTVIFSTGAFFMQDFMASASLYFTFSPDLCHSSECRTSFNSFLATSFLSIFPMTSPPVVHWSASKQFFQLCMRIFCIFLINIHAV